MNRHTDGVDTDVLIVGAGPTGLTLACDLARRGVACRVLERAAGELPGTRGAGVQPRTREIFGDLGVLDAIHAAGGTYPTLQLWGGTTVLGTSEIEERQAPTPDRPFGELWMLPQWRTVRILRARFEELGGLVEYHAQLASLTKESGRVTAVLSDGSELRARYLVGADGSRSAVRESLGVGFERVALDAPPMLIGDVLLDGLDAVHWHVWPKAPGGMVTLCPIKGSDTYYFLVQFPGGEPDASRDGDLGSLQDLLRRRTGHEGLALREVRYASVLSPTAAMAERFREGRVFLAGDAAHIHSPTGGQGLNTSVQDAYNLGWKLGAVLRQGAPGSLLDTYESERRGVAAELLERTTRILGADQAGGTGFSKRGRDIQQLDLAYPGSPLTTEHRDGPLPEGALRAGDRAPDAPGTDSAGTAVRLFDLFRGPHFTLLAFGAAPEVPDGLVRTVRVGESFLDTGGHVRDAYGGRGLFLVRPDGYVALACDRPSDVTAYLAELFPQVKAG